MVRHSQRTLVYIFVVIGFNADNNMQIVEANKLVNKSVLSISFMLSHYIYRFMYEICVFISGIPYVGFPVIYVNIICPVSHRMRGNYALLKQRVML